MGKRHNSVIKFDLHIHSKASSYKEKDGIVDNSNVENIPILLTKLNEHNVSLFSITDHNRFDPDLYQAIEKTLSDSENTYPNVKAILPGVEFDVKLDDSRDKCHIIAIFDTKNKSEKLKQIKAGLQSDLLTDEKEFYTKERFESVLYEIGLDTILIASQHKDIRNHDGNHNSLSDTSENVEEIIKVGYIDALEFQKPKVEAILKNNLKDLSIPITLLSGSDCHDWSCYPYHDAHNQNKAFHHSKAKILPTFKGLLMAITSPETRFNCRENINHSFYSGISLKEQKIEFVNGINAIIGENGSGKTTLLELINRNISAKYVKKIIEDNNLQVIDTIDSEKVKYIKQGQIVEKFNNRELFSSEEENNFIELDHKHFETVYSYYAGAIQKNIKFNIDKKQKFSSLAKCTITFDSNLEGNSYYVNVTCPRKFSSVQNPHELPRNEINELISKMNNLGHQEYYQIHKVQLDNIINILNEIKQSIDNNWRIIDYEARVKSIMHSCINDYSQKLKISSTTRDNEVIEYKVKKESVIDLVIEAIKMSIEKIEWPYEPSVIHGVSKNPKRGFYFNREAAYNGVLMIDDFYKKMFVKDYRSIEKLQEIDDYDDLRKAIMNCTSNTDIDTSWKENLRKFYNEATKMKDYITDGTDQQIGNTLGEMSLSYYKFFTQDHDEWNVLIVDQPEDNISNNNISQKLINYFQAIRSEKQLIFVTHNPLLVVNLDADNVIFVRNENGVISINDGCLEYEDEQTNILELIAQNMDGGKETIEKRLKVYGKKY